MEINSTFYRPCAPRTAAGWAARTPADFEFTVKAWQEFTHGREAPAPEEIALFREGIAPIAESGKLGCLLFQFPTSFHCDDGTRDRLRALLGSFADFQKAVELRHRSWDDNLDVMNETGTIPVFIDEPKFRDSIRQTLQSSGGMLYVRLHGRRADTWWRHEHRNDRYDYLYSKDEIRVYADRLKASTGEQAIQKAYIFFNNHPGAKAVVNAAMLREELGIPVAEPLPRTLKLPEGFS